MDLSDLSAAPIPKWTPSSPSAANIYSPHGQISVPGPTGPVYLDDAHVLDFEDDSLQGKITPALAAQTMGLLDANLDGGFSSFSGSDLRIMVEVPFASRLHLAAHPVPDLENERLALEPSKIPGDACVWRVLRP